MMRIAIKGVFLLIVVLTTSCGKVLDLYVNEALTNNRPRKILYSQALGISSMNSIVENGGSYFDKVVFDSFANYNINAEPVTIYSEDFDSTRVAEVCRSLNAEGLLLTKFIRTYQEDQNSNQIALSSGATMRMLYYNSKGELVASLLFYPPHDEDVKSSMKKGVHFGVKKLVTTCWDY